MGRLFLIDAAAAVALVGLWFLCLASYNRRRGAKALHWVEAPAQIEAKCPKPDGLEPPPAGALAIRHPLV